MKQTAPAARTRIGLARSPCHPAGTLITVAATLYSTYKTSASCVAAVWLRPGCNRSVARKTSKVAAALPSSNASTPTMSRPSRPRRTGRTRIRIGWLVRALAAAVWRMA